MSTGKLALDITRTYIYIICVLGLGLEEVLFFAASTYPVELSRKPRMWTVIQV